MHLSVLISFSCLALVQAQKPGDDGFDETILYIVMGVIVDILLLLACIWHIYPSCKKGQVQYGKPVVPAGQDPKEFAIEELQAAFDAKNAARYAGALELALEVKVEPGRIPCVYSLHKQLQTFKIPVVQRGPSVITAQLCFILDYTGSMKEQINQAGSVPVCLARWTCVSCQLGKAAALLTFPSCCTDISDFHGRPSGESMLQRSFVRVSPLYGKPWV